MTPNSDVWRLIVHDRVDGRLNMAIDRAMQLARDEGSAPPTLRLYRWVRPTVTLGRFQDVASVDLDESAARGVDVVRRFTGGRGVLHDDEVTYSVVANLSDGIPRGVTASYDRISAGLVAAYSALGVRAELTSRARGQRSASSCYLQTTRADLTAQGRKVSGSAQVWSGDTVLQHGSLIIRRDVCREARVFGLSVEQSAHLASATRTLEDLVGRRVAVEEIHGAVADGFEEALGVRLDPGDLTAREASLAAGVLDQTRVVASPDAVSEADPRVNV